ncbi:D-hexose-6-phosphate mutarotase [Pseudogulbenkiania subflava]|uniref:Putative glucose-6-phosphate 1-epimerase n=1 Tax=Pseudogulbenkiania subflava DSM 22618 TaxID=1123014 RepID=A0A1Y6CCG1_9NEIS|nr:D-hexose-6-phosphate mutarotase [Pseudogulbenkiania subflava]SMF56807.1 glucose-6-phosphate 1-epimerase [Pseudogulbenkiania subflava DSM 22618]
MSLPLPDGATLSELAPGVTLLTLAHDRFDARLSLLGGQLLDYTRHGEPPLLYLSPAAVFQPGKAIRGGIPLCWPWFGAHPDDANAPAHGVARQQPWVLQQVMRDAAGFSVRLAGPRHGALEASLELRLDDAVELALTTRNHSSAPATLSAALHSYLALGDIDGATLTGLAGASYLDQLQGQLSRFGNEPLRFECEIDAIVYPEGPLTLHDAAWGRTVTLSTAGSASSVVWNPWIAKSARLADLPDDGYRHFVCVETANAGRDARRLAPGESHTLRTRLQAQPSR